MEAQPAGPPLPFVPPAVRAFSYNCRTRDSDQPILESIQRSADTIASLSRQTLQIATICDAVVGALKGGHKILTCGHGGSAADALHMAEELLGRFLGDRQPLPAVALVADPTLLTCIGNDYGFEAIFPRQVEGLGQRGDVLVIFSTSGKGEGFKRAAEAAKAKGVTTIALLGKGGGPLKPLVDHALVVDGDETARIQEAHILIGHTICGAAEQQLGLVPGEGA